jgi:hypothetical protein
MPEGKFVKRLHEVSVGVLPSIGFKPSTTPPPPSLLLTVSLPAIDAEHAQAALDGGAEALIVRLGLQELVRETTKLQDIVAAAEGKPCGVLIVGSSDNELEGVKELKSLGFDFVVLSAHDNPSILRLEDFGKIMIVDHTFDNDLTRTINDLPIDAVEVSLARPEDVGRHFSIRDLMNYKLFKMLVRKPVVVRGERSIRPEDMEGLFDVGIEGVIVDATVTGSDPQSIRQAVSAYRDAIVKLEPRTRKKPSKGMALLPTTRPRAAVPEVEPEEPEEPDEPDEV